MGDELVVAAVTGEERDSAAGQRAHRGGYDHLSVTLGAKPKSDVQTADRTVIALLAILAIVIAWICHAASLAPQALSWTITFSLVLYALRIAERHRAVCGVVPKHYLPAQRLVRFGFVFSYPFKPGRAI